MFIFIDSLKYYFIYYLKFHINTQKKSIFLNIINKF